MAIIIYQNGIVENIVPKDLVFTENELINIFNDFSKVSSKRYVEFPDTWCLWGENKTYKDDDYNAIASGLIDRDIFSAVVFIHDTEIPLEWNITNSPILKNYNEFHNIILKHIDEMAEVILNETETMQKQNGESNLVFLNTIGTTEDKRVLLEFNPHLQSEKFYEPFYFQQFCNKSFDYLKAFYKQNGAFVIWADNKIIILVKDENVKYFIDKLNENFQQSEHYEICKEVKEIGDYYFTKLEKKSKKKTKKKQIDASINSNKIEKSN